MAFFFFFPSGARYTKTMDRITLLSLLLLFSQECLSFTTGWKSALLSAVKSARSSNQVNNADFSDGCSIINRRRTSNGSQLYPIYDRVLPLIKDLGRHYSGSKNHCGVDFDLEGLVRTAQGQRVSYYDYPLRVEVQQHEVTARFFRKDFSGFNVFLCAQRAGRKSLVLRGGDVDAVMGFDSENKLQAASIVAYKTPLINLGSDFQSKWRPYTKSYCRVEH